MEFDVKERQVIYMLLNGLSVITTDSKSLTVEVGGADLNEILGRQVPVKTGYMHKQTSSAIFKTWKKRYFILRKDGCLYYYKTDQVRACEEPNMFFCFYKDEPSLKIKKLDIHLYFIATKHL